MSKKEHEIFKRPVGRRGKILQSPLEYALRRSTLSEALLGKIGVDTPELRSAFYRLVNNERITDARILADKLNKIKSGG